MFGPCEHRFKSGNLKELFLSVISRRSHYGALWFSCFWGLWAYSFAFLFQFQVSFKVSDPKNKRIVVCTSVVAFTFRR